MKNEDCPLCDGHGWIESGCWVGAKYYPDDISCPICKLRKELEEKIREFGLDYKVVLKEDDEE